MADIERILQRLEAIEAEVRELKQVLRDLDQPTESSAITAASDAATKLELYLSRFAGRRDVYAQAWESRSTGKKGWSPAVRGGFFDRQKLTHDFLPLTDDVLYRHLQGGGSPIGLYVMMSGDQCQLLACDFDGHSWREDAAAYAEACREQGLDPLCEISRSGDGAHVWLFFEAPVPAASARSAGMRAIAAELRSLIDAQVLIMHGGQKKDERASVRAAVVKRAAENEPFVLVAMGKVAGEGLDLPALHTLFLAAPISFKGVVVQQLGRITRSSGGEAPATAAVVHDFVDDDVAVLQRMHRRRFRTMQKEGFILSSPGDC